MVGRLLGETNKIRSNEQIEPKPQLRSKAAVTKDGIGEHRDTIEAMGLDPGELRARKKLTNVSLPSPKQAETRPVSPEQPATQPATPREKATDSIDKQARQLVERWNAGQGQGGWNEKDKAAILKEASASPELYQKFYDLIVIKKRS